MKIISIITPDGRPKSPELIEALARLASVPWMKSPCPYCDKPITPEDIEIHHARVVSADLKILAHDACYRAAHPGFDAAHDLEDDNGNNP